SSFLFFFSSRRRHTRFSRDWSSDVCSSDLSRRLPIRTASAPAAESRIQRFSFFTFLSGFLLLFSGVLRTECTRQKSGPQPSGNRSAQLPRRHPWFPPRPWPQLDPLGCPHCGHGLGYMSGRRSLQLLEDVARPGVLLPLGRRLEAGLHPPEHHGVVVAVRAGHVLHHGGEPLDGLGGEALG